MNELDNEAVGDIRAATLRCVGNFKTLLESFQSENLNTETKHMTVEVVENEFARFKIWTGSLGASQRGSSSLDVRLRDSVVLRNAILRLLKRLAGTLMQSKLKRCQF
jgi:hypothetical protein